jgi:hypothetical protein
MIFSEKQFAVLIPTGLISEVARFEDVDGVPTYDQHIENLIYNLSKANCATTNK